MDDNIQVAPALDGWWTKSQSVAGSSVELDIRALQSRGNIIPVAAVPHGMGPPNPITISFSRVNTRGSEPSGNWGIRAQLKVGAGGTSHTARCDWNTGNQVNIASVGSVTIEAVTYAPNPSEPYSIGDSDDFLVQLAASVGISAGSIHPPPRLTQRLPDLAGMASTGAQEPPKWTEALMVNLCDVNLIEGFQNPYLDDLALYWIDSAGLRQAVIPASEFPNQWIPVPADCRAELISGEAGGLYRPTFMWRLAL